MSFGMFMLVFFGGIALMLGIVPLIRKCFNVDNWLLGTVAMCVMSIWVFLGLLVTMNIATGTACTKQALRKEIMVVPDVLRCESRVYVTTSDGERVCADVAETDGESYFVQERWSTWGIYNDNHYYVYIGTDADKEVSADELRAYLPKWSSVMYRGGGN